MLTNQFLKIRKKIEIFIQFITPFIWRKNVSGRRVTFPAESTLSSVRMTKKLPRLTELTAGRLSSPKQSKIFGIPVLIHVAACVYCFKDGYIQIIYRV